MQNPNVQTLAPPPPVRTAHRLTLIPLVLALIAAVALSACSRQHDETAGQKLDGAIASAEQKSDQARADTAQTVENGKAAVAKAAQDVKQMAGEAADKVADKAGDAAITASVNAELARDPKLSALKINVNTVSGSVVLKGTAPDRDSRDRATALARNVKGVMQVDNQLVVTSTG